MYDRMTNTHGINNLIWVYTHAQSLASNWYPSDNYVDIVGILFSQGPILVNFNQCFLAIP